MADRPAARLVYSSNVGRVCPGCGWPASDCKCSSTFANDPVPTRIVAKLRLEKKGRGGKSVTVVDGLPRNAEFLGALYDLLVANRGLMMTLQSADAFSEEELTEAGIHDIGRAMATLGRIGAQGIDIKGLTSRHHDLAARSTVAMVAGMAAFGTTLFDARPPSRDAIVEELTQMTLHGFLHREG